MALKNLNIMTVETLTSVVNQVLPEPHAGLLNGILFGTKATVSKELYNALIQTGTLHIVALSGMNITIIALIINSVLLPFVSRRIASILTILGIILFVWFVGASPSVVRAAIMGSISLLAITLGRQAWSLLSWVLALGIMLVIKPSWIGDISFQLSALATIGIILFGGNTHVPRQINKNSKNKDRGFLEVLKNGGIENFRLTLAAQVFTIPLIFFQFHRLSLVSPLSNVLIGWTIQIITILGLLVSIVGLIFLPFAQIVALPTWVFLQYLVMVVDLTSKIPFASIGW